MKQVLIVILALFAAGLAGGAFWLWTPDKPRAALEAKYLATPGDMREVSGIRLHVRDSGAKDAPAVILLHGFGASLHTWEPWAKALEADFRVIRLDIPGFGLTGPDPRGDYSTPRAVAVVLGLMDQLGLAKATLIGHSMGGKIAWNFAVAHPDRLARLVLVSPDGFAAPGGAYGRKPHLPATLKLMRYALPKAMLRPNLAIAYADPARLTDETVTRYHDLMLAPGQRDAMLANLEQAVLVDPAPLLPQIKAPVLLLWGERDGMIPHSHAQDYLKLLPDVRLASLPGLGHVPHEEAPEASLPPLRAFLAP